MIVSNFSSIGKELVEFSASEITNPKPYEYTVPFYILENMNL